MRFLRNFLLTFLLLAQQLSSAAQTDSCSLNISLLTCSPGEELYSLFGHSAIRVQDRTNHTDIIYNYGTFDFNDPDFYTKFIKGRLLYFVSVEDFNNFMYAYTLEGRGIQEQTLQLTCEQKRNLQKALQENAREENKYYQYDFIYDNCSTRLRDMVEKNSGHAWTLHNILPTHNTTFRQLIHEYLQQDHQQWNKLGIDLLMGMPTDKKASSKEAMFLPDYLLKGFDSSSFNHQPLVAQKHILLPPGNTRVSTGGFTPILFFSILFAVITILSFLPWRFTRILLAIFDRIFFVVIGLLGLLLLYLWLGSNHGAFKNNLNILWALPTHFFIAFVMGKQVLWVKQYFTFTWIFTFVLVLCWFILPQQLNTSLFPIVGMIIVRAYCRSQK